MSCDLSEPVRAAHGDAWQVEGRLRAPLGGGAAELPGVRVMAPGLPGAAWNNGHVTSPEAVDVGAVRAWYAERSVPWGLCVPAEAAAGLDVYVDVQAPSSSSD